MRRRTLIVLAVAAVVVAGPELVCRLWPTPRIDPSRPWHLEVARGSGMFGFNTVRLDHTGTLAVERFKFRDGVRQYDRNGEMARETASCRLAPEDVSRVLDAVEADGILRLSRRYVNPNVYDGYQMVLRAGQEGWTRTVYCSNEFPGGLVRFSDRLFGLVARLDGTELRWEDVPPEKTRR